MPGSVNFGAGDSGERARQGAGIVTFEVEHAGRPRGPGRVDVADGRLLEDAVHQTLLLVFHLGEVFCELAILQQAIPDQRSATRCQA